MIVADEALVLQPPTRAYPLCEASCEPARFDGRHRHRRRRLQRRRARRRGRVPPRARAAGARVVGATARARTGPRVRSRTFRATRSGPNSRCAGCRRLPSGARRPARAAAASDAAPRALADAGARDERARRGRGARARVAPAVAPGVSLPRVPLEPWDSKRSNATRRRPPARPPCLVHRVRRCVSGDSAPRATPQSRERAEPFHGEAPHASTRGPWRHRAVRR